MCYYNRLLLGNYFSVTVSKGEIKRSLNIKKKAS
jgi:hypothetical protein